MEFVDRLRVHSGALTVSLVLILVTAVVVRAYNILIGRPLRIFRILQSQGIPGYPFCPVFGQILTFLAIDKKREADPALAAASGGTNMIALGFQLFGDEKQLPPLWTFSLGTTIVLVVSDPDIVRQMLVAQNSNFVNPALKKQALWLLGDGLLTSDGPHWEKQRRLINPSLSMREVKRYVPLMFKCAKEAVEGWKASLVQEMNSQGKAPEKERLSVQPLMMNVELASLTLDVVFRAVLGTQVDQILSPERVRLLQNALARHFPKSMQAGFFNFLIPFYGYLPTSINKIVNDTSRIIEEDLHRVVSHRLRERDARLKVIKLDGAASTESAHKSSQQDDLLSILIDATDDSTLATDQHGTREQRGEHHATRKTIGNKGGTRMTLQQLMDECATFIMAGSETTANLLTWTMLLLSQHPEWQERAREEVVRLSEGWEEGPTFEDLNEMKVVSCILYETLRLMPAAPVIGRTAKTDTWVTKDLLVPEGCDVYIGIQVMHRCKEYWGQDAEQFNPERFANGTGKASLHPGAFMPFSIGPRNCVGQNFALVEAKVILSCLLKNFSWTVADSYLHHPEALVTMQAKHGLPVSLQSLD